MAPGVWLIAGPTASGKSAAALAVAERTGGEIVNADALQLYRDLRVLTARPSPRDEAQAPHHLYGMADASEAWSVGRWLRAVAPVLGALAARGVPAIVTGGTGLYFRALTVGLAPTPPASDAVRAETQARLEMLGEDAFLEELARVDPVAAGRIAPGDRQRLVRAAAVARETGRPLSAWQAETHPTLPHGSWTGVVLEPPRAELYARCDARLDAMLAAGALEEVAALTASALDPALPAMKAVGLRELAAGLAGEVSMGEAVETAKRQTRRFAKRQSTWFRNQTPDWPRAWDAEAAVRLILAQSRA